MAAYNDLNIDRSLIEGVINDNLEGSTLNKKNNPNKTSNLSIVKYLSDILYKYIQNNSLY